MSSVKILRGQVRQIVKELLPEVFSSEILSELRKEQKSELDKLAAHVKEQMKLIEDRTKDVQSFLIRESVKNTSVRPTSKE